MCSIIDNLLGDVKLQFLQMAAERERFSVATTLDESIGSSKFVDGAVGAVDVAVADTVAANGDDVTPDDNSDDGSSNCLDKASRWTVRRWRANFCACRDAYTHNSH